MSTFSLALALPTKSLYSPVKLFLLLCSGSKIISNHSARKTSITPLLNNNYEQKFSFSHCNPVYFPGFAFAFACFIEEGVFGYNSAISYQTIKFIPTFKSKSYGIQVVGGF